MTDDELAQRKDALLDRYLDGEIDKATYDALLARLQQRASGSPGGCDDLDRLATLGPAARDGEPVSPSATPPEAPGSDRDLGREQTVYRRAPAPLEPGVALGGFRLVEIIGRGGMGEVWKAHDPAADRHVVIKVVPPDVQHASAEMARVCETFRRIHALHHQHVCPVYVLGEDPRCGHFVVMQFIDGTPLSSYRDGVLSRHGTFDLDATVRVLAPVAAALDYAHRNRVVHRDIKPDNILVIGDGEDVQVVDFGLAAEIHTSITRVSNVRMDTSGTRPYMAPEQWRGEYQDARTDQYALGVVAYELLAGRLPFESPDPEVLRLCVLNDPPPLLDGHPEHVGRAIHRALAKRREDRFDNCTEFIEALRATPTEAVIEPWEIRLGPVDAPPQSDAETEVEEQAPVREPAEPHVEPTTPARVEEPKPALSAVTNAIGMRLVPIPAGEFLMGSPDSDPAAYRSEKPQHRVAITRPFYLGACPVTQDQYEQVMGSNPSYFKAAGPDAPVESVSWEAAWRFCERLSQMPEEKMARRVYRLPTEAEWEYACRAGTTTRFCFGDDETPLGQFAWFEGNAEGTTHPVGQKSPNAWGLFDVHGNVWEWCADWYNERHYEVSAPADPQGPEFGTFHVARGGGWYARPSFCRSADRFRVQSAAFPHHGSDGFRVVCEPS